MTEKQIMNNAALNRTKNAEQHRGFIRTSLAAAILAIIAAPASALAQSASDDTDGASAIEEIIVTAQRREQSLQEVPMAISAFTGADLEALQADNLDSLQGAVPNLMPNRSFGHVVRRGTHTDASWQALDRSDRSGANEIEG